MKCNILILFVLIPLLCNSQPPQDKGIVIKNLLFSVNTSGGDISGKHGSVSYSIGQVNQLNYDENSINTSEGVQQPLIISITPLEIIDDLEVIKMAAYPNPTTNFFKIEASSYTDRYLKYQLTDIHGNFIEEGRIEDPGATVDISRLAVAMYLLHVTNGTKHIKTFKIIKK